MKTGWVKSELQIGERVRVPDEIFIVGEKARERLLATEYVGETAAGLIFRSYFRPGWGEKEPRSYRFFINWATLYCGKVKIYRKDGTTVRARRTDEDFDISIIEKENEDDKG